MSELYGKGLEVRREVLGREYVDRSVAATDEVAQPFQDLLTGGRGGTQG